MRPVLVLLIATLSIAAQTARKTPAPAAPAKPAARDEFQKATLHSISVEGNQIYRTPNVVAATGLKIGQPVGKAEFDAARDRLIASGAFSTVGYRYKPEGSGYAAVFQVTEIQQAFPYRIQGLPVDPKLVAERIQSKEPLYVEKVPGTEEVLGRIAKEIEAVLASQNHTEKVVGRLAAEAGGDMVVVFRPARLASVAEVHFVGNRDVATVTLQGAIAGVGVGSQYTEENFRLLLDTSIRPLYEKIGEIRVSFPKITTEPAKEVSGLVVTVQVVEGPVYKLSEVHLLGPLADDEKLLKEGGFKTGETANFSEIKAGIDKMEASLRRDGYMRATSTTERKVDDANHTVAVNVTIQPGTQFKFGALSIDGLDIQTEPQIRKMWAMKPGQPYNADYPYYFLHRLESDGVFENLGKTRTALHVDDENQIVDVTLFFASNGAPLPSIGPARDQLERRRRAEEKNKGPQF